MSQTSGAARFDEMVCPTISSNLAAPLVCIIEHTGNIPATMHGTTGFLDHELSCETFQAKGRPTEIQVVHCAYIITS